jgi:uncharacterized SAM-binding protein YcdF (DUF218 family)
MADKTKQDARLSDELVRDITSLIFDIDTAHDAQGKTVQILGNLTFIPAMVEKIRSLGEAREYIISGGINPRYLEPENKQETQLVENMYMNGWPCAKQGEIFEIPEAYLIKAALTHATTWFDRIPARLEAESINTYENFRLPYYLGYYKDVRNLVIVTSAENALRALGSAKAALPPGTEMEIEAAPYVASIPVLGAFADRERWMNHPLSRSLVLSEVKNMPKYAREKQVALPNDKLALLRRVAGRLR